MTPQPPSTSPRTGSTARNTGVDVLRIVSIVAVVVGHVYASDLEWRRYLEIWRMPLFFFLSGFFFTRGRTFAFEARQRWRTLAVPYLAWGVLMSLAAWRWNSDDPAQFWELMARGWYGGSWQDPPWWAFWFISVLFFTTLLRRWLERYPSWVAWAVSMVGLGLAQITGGDDYPAGPMGLLPLGIGLALPCMFYILCGEFLRYEVLARYASIPGTRLEHHDGARRLGPHQLASLGIVLVLLGGLAVAAGIPSHNIKFSGFGLFLITPIVGVVMATGMLLIFGTWVNMALGWARPAVNALVRTGTVVVLAHGYIIIKLAQFNVDENFSRFALTVLISWALGLLINATPLSPLLSGVPAPEWWKRRRAAAASSSGDAASGSAPTS
ncbi:acyltransferase family protein [Citricoccus muralis]|uniref:Acyltransferase family protein n=1 Tax=Citricoccus muralis TaxID=169134 RepID=A0ABY8H8H7_9MICC|nr:acyltransferase family protein [Citricoccus muralis]WFP17445.1 acyltransferase family protein [Citricoccus muralis]